jgi:hypothetical protein
MEPIRLRREETRHLKDSTNATPKGKRAAGVATASRPSWEDVSCRVQGEPGKRQRSTAEPPHDHGRPPLTRPSHARIPRRCGSHSVPSGMKLSAPLPVIVTLVRWGVDWLSRAPLNCRRERIHWHPSLIKHIVSLGGRSGTTPKRRRHGRPPSAVLANGGDEICCSVLRPSTRHKP